LIPYDRKNNTINSIKVNEEHGYNNLNGRGVTRSVYFNVGIRIGIIAPYIYSEKICTVGRLDPSPAWQVQFTRSDEIESVNKTIIHDI